MMTRHQQQHQPIGSDDKREGIVGAISLWAFNFRLWLLDPFAECRKATECRQAQEDEDDDMSWVEFKFRALPANRGTMWTPRMDLPPPHLSEEFNYKCPSKVSPPAATTPTFTSPPSSHCGGDDGNDHIVNDNNDSDINIHIDSDSDSAATEQSPSIGGIGGGGGGGRFSDGNDKGKEQGMPCPSVPVAAGGVSSSSSISFPMATPPPASMPPSKSPFTTDDLVGSKLWWF